MNFQYLRLRTQTLAHPNMGHHPKETESSTSRIFEGSNKFDEITTEALFRSKPNCVGLLEELRSNSWCTFGTSLHQCNFHTSFKQGAIGLVVFPRITLSQGKPKERTVKGFGQAP